MVLPLHNLTTLFLLSFLYPTHTHSPLFPIFPKQNQTQTQTHTHNTSVQLVMSCNIGWSREEDKAFEKAIALSWNNNENDIENEQGSLSSSTWEKIASLVPTKTIEELKRHYQMLVEDVTAIESGNIPLPSYSGSDATTTTTTRANASDKRVRSNRGSSNGSGFAALGGHDSSKGGSSKSEQDRKKGIPWTEEEHRLFLLGLDKFGKGDWRSISRNFVISRTPTQVASHAQKYFIRLNSMNRDRRRSSIHDITSVNNGADVPNHQVPITGQQGNAYAPNAAAIGPPSVKHRPPHQPHMAGLGMYGTPMGHTVAAHPAHMASAVGTPVMLPPGHHPHHPPYVMPVAYPMAHPSMHQ